MNYAAEYGGGGRVLAGWRVNPGCVGRHHWSLSLKNRFKSKHFNSLRDDVNTSNGCGMWGIEENTLGDEYITLVRGRHLVPATFPSESYEMSFTSDESKIPLRAVEM